MSVDARRLMACIRCMDVAERAGYSAVWLRNYNLARVVAARLIGGQQ